MSRCMTKEGGGDGYGSSRISRSGYVWQTSNQLINVSHVPVGELILIGPTNTSTSDVEEFSECMLSREAVHLSEV